MFSLVICNVSHLRNFCRVGSFACVPAGNASQESVLAQGSPQRTQMLAFKEFEPERNVFEEFDAG